MAVLFSNANQSALLVRFKPSVYLRQRQKRRGSGTLYLLMLHPRASVRPEMEGHGGQSCSAAG